MFFSFLLILSDINFVTSISRHFLDLKLFESIVMEQVFEQKLMQAAQAVEEQVRRFNRIQECIEHISV